MMPQPTLEDKLRWSLELAQRDRAAGPIPVPTETPGSSSPAPGVYRAIAAVMRRLAVTGIAKSRTNAQQHYAFRGVDDIYNALGPLLAEEGLLMLPRVLDRQVEERESKNGGALFSCSVQVAYDLVCAGDGSTHTITTVGEAMDSGDKATNKAMSAAFKYAALQAFCIPTEGDNDADATTPEPVTPRFKSEAPTRDELLAQLKQLRAAAGESAYNAALERHGAATGIKTLGQARRVAAELSALAAKEVRQ